MADVLSRNSSAINNLFTEYTVQETVKAQENDVSLCSAILNQVYSISIIPACHLSSP